MRLTVQINPDQFLNPLWRLSNLYWIVNKHGKAVPFEMNDYQAKFINGLHGWDIILKARQLGFTTFAGIIAVDEGVFNPNWTSAIIAHTKPDAQKILKNKVKFPYERLPDGIKDSVSPISDAADTFALSNGSSIIVTNSARGGTLQRLHVSEFGKICARFPEKAAEIVSGSFPAAENGHITIESTAEGQQGQFFDMTQTSIGMIGKPHSPKDFKFHFFPWWEADEYRLNPTMVELPKSDQDYFAKLEREDGIKLDEWQRAWWTKQNELLGGLMKREYPATPREAFEQALEGAYFERQLAHATVTGAIGRFPFDMRYEVNTFWDIGRNDLTAIWLHQFIEGRHRFIGYYENSGEHISHYLNWLKDWRRHMGAAWGEDYLPHDGRREDLFLEHGRLGAMDELGFHPEIVDRTTNKMNAIETARAIFPRCDFDANACELGLKRLKHYRKEWDDLRGVWKDKPKHDDNSNGADAFMTFSTGYTEPVEVEPDIWEGREGYGQNEATGY